MREIQVYYSILQRLTEMYWCTGSGTVRIHWNRASLGEPADHQRRKYGHYHTLCYDPDTIIRCSWFLRRRSEARCPPGFGSCRYQCQVL